MKSKYWVQRERDKLYNQKLKYADEQLAKQYVRCAEETKDQLVALYNELLVDAENGTILQSDLYKYNRYFDLLNSLNNRLNKLGSKEIQLTEQVLTDMYNSNSQLITDELGFIKTVNEENVKSCINAIWCADGKHWSDRIWTNKSALQERVMNGLVDCIARGASKDELVKQLRSDMNVGFNQADRIARTELSFVQNQSVLNKYAEAGIQKYEFLAEIDDRTCDVCADMNGKIFYLKDATVGVNYPPLHPNCRSTTLAVL